jgi:hypothetical protein
MDDMVIVLRMAERITAVLIGGISIYFGYRLFFHLPLDTNHEGKLELPGIKIVLSRVGPGVFFAAFGSAVLYFSLTSPVSFSTGPVTGSVAQLDPASTVASFQGAGNAPPVIHSAVNSPPTPQALGLAATSIEMLNCADQLLAASGNTEGYQQELTLALQNARYTLLLSVWNESEWGPKPAVIHADINQELTADARALLTASYPGCGR